MAFAVAFLGIIAIATGITLLPGPKSHTPPASAAPAAPVSAAPAPGQDGNQK